jgi:hypothetical protein
VSPIVPPSLAGIAAAAGAWHWAVYPTLDAAGAVGLGGTVASISTTMLGFMLAALAVLASINHTHLVNMMRTYGHYRDLLITMMIGCLLFMACAILGFAMLFGLPSNAKLVCFLIALHVSALVSLIDVGRKLWLVLSNLRST